jgi:hypothetical protein
MQATRTTEDRLAELDAIEAIKALKYRYWRYCDGKDPVGFRSCFIRKGASMDYGPLGAYDDVEPIAKIFEEVALKKVDGRYMVLDMHHGLMPEITILSPTEAIGKWTLHFRQVNTVEKTESLSAGEYDDAYVIEDGEWKMSKSHHRGLWSITRPIGDEVVVQQLQP